MSAEGKRTLALGLVLVLLLVGAAVAIASNPVALVYGAFVLIAALGAGALFLVVRGLWPKRISLRGAITAQRRMER